MTDPKIAVKTVGVVERSRGSKSQEGVVEMITEEQDTGGSKKAKEVGFEAD